MNILFVNHLPMGTASFYRQAGIAKFLKEKGHRPKMLLRSKPFSGQERHENNITETNISYWNEPFEYLFLPNSLQALKHIKNADVIYLNRANPFSATSTLLARFFSRKPLIVDLEDWDAIGGYSSMAQISRTKKFAMTFFEEMVPPKSDCVVTVSKYLYHRMIAMGIPEDRVFYAPNAVDTEIFNPHVDGKEEEIRRRYNLGERVIVIMGIFYAFEFRIWKLLLDIFSYVLKEVPDTKILIIGWGKGLNSLKKLAEKKGIREHVVTPGYIEREELPKFIAAGNVALHILDNRFFYCHNQSPNTIAEFMAMGKPIVATDVGEVYEALKDVGILIRDSKPQSYCKPLIKILTDLTLQKKYGEAARSRAVEKYSMQILGEKVEKACEKALEVRRKKS